MRITVGHVLILTGLGGAGWMYISSHKMDSSGLLEKYSSVSSSVDSLMDLFKSGAQPTPTLNAETKTDPVPEIPVVEDKLPALEAAANAETIPPVQNPVANTQEVKPAVIETPVLVKKIAKGRRPKRNRAKTAKDPLLGNMVALTLSSGREVRGILEERTAASYKIQLPGMGPFTYDAANVKAIKAAK